MNNENLRIPILDGFRAIAIISVMLFHYFSRWAPPLNNISLYPYSNNYSYFNYGYLGVQFFFIISGFVIFFTLEKTNDLATFWKKRMIRLLPSMIVASLITFFVFICFDNSNIFPSSHLLKNFIPSITFISPHLITDIFKIEVGYINGSYWSLWPEIQFYFLASLIYYLNKKEFIRNFMSVCFVLIFANYLISHIQGSNKLNIELPMDILVWYSKWISGRFNLINYLPLFCTGIILYKFSTNNRRNIKTSLFIKMCFLLLVMYMIYSDQRIPVRLIYILILSGFYVFIYYPSKFNVLENSTITSIGKSSYFLYLIHENIGVLIIFTVGQRIAPYSFILPLILIFSLTYLSILFSIKVDNPINNWLKGKLLKN